MLGAIATPDLVLYLSVMIVAAVVHGTLGLGFPLIATPLLSLFVDVRTAILITLLPTVTVNVLSITTAREWAGSVAKFWPLAFWCLLGAVAGAVLIAVSDPEPFKLLLAVLVFLYLIVERFESGMFNRLRRYPRSSQAGFGLIAGVSAGSTNTMVPILIIYALEFAWKPSVMVVMFNLCFFSGKVSQVAVFSATGFYSWSLALATVPLAVAAGAALLAGRKFRDRIVSERYRQIIKAVLFLLGVALVIQFFMGT